jgi:hypothetical protein
MKKIILTTLIAVVCFSANAQVTFGIHGNVIGASIKEKDFLNYGATSPDEMLDWKKGTRASWKFGAIMNMPLSETFSFQPQLNILNKGGNFSTFYSESDQGASLELDIDADIKLTYLELPLNFVYNTSKFFIGAGPSLSYGLDGELVAKVKFVYDDGFDRIEDSGSETEEIEFNNEEDEEQPSLKPFELGANFIAGYKIKENIFINVHYNLGLSNISNYEDTEFKNRYFGIGVGYMFNKK